MFCFRRLGGPEVRSVADLAGDEAGVAGGPLRRCAVFLGRRRGGDPPGHRTVVAPRGFPKQETLEVPPERSAPWHSAQEVIPPLS